MALTDGLRPLADKYFGKEWWSAHTPRQTCYALLAKAYIDEWSMYAPESVFLIQCYHWLALPNAMGIG